MFTLLKPYKYVVDAVVLAALVAGLAFGVHKYNEHQQEIGEARVQAQWDKEKKQIEVDSQKLKDANATKEKALQATADTIRSQADVQIQALNSSLASAIAGLRERPSRDGSGNMPHDPSTGATLGATGADLLRQDSEFLVREASRADKLRLQLAQCQAQYNSVKDKLQGNN